MGLDYSVYGLIDIEDEEVKKMLQAKKAMIDAGIFNSSQEFIDKFKSLTGCHPDQYDNIDELIEEIRRVDIPTREGSGSCSNYWEVDIKDIPDKVKYIRFEVSY